MKIIFSLKYNDCDNTHEQLITEKFFSDVLGLSVTRVNGKYLGKKEYSLMVDNVEKEDLNLIKRIANNFKQESILLVNMDNNRAYLFYFDTETTEHIGLWTEVSESKAERLLSYSKIEGKYYVAR